MCHLTNSPWTEMFLQVPHYSLDPQYQNVTFVFWTVGEPYTGSHIVFMNYATNVVMENLNNQNMSDCSYCHDSRSVDTTPAASMWILLVVCTPPLVFQVFRHPGIQKKCYKKCALAVSSTTGSKDSTCSTVLIWMRNNHRTYFHLIGRGMV